MMREVDTVLERVERFDTDKMVCQAVRVSSIVLAMSKNSSCYDRKSLSERTRPGPLQNVASGSKNLACIQVEVPQLNWWILSVQLSWVDEAEETLTHNTLRHLLHAYANLYVSGWGQRFIARLDDQ